VQLEIIRAVENAGKQTAEANIARERNWELKRSAGKSFENNLVAIKDFGYHLSSAKWVNWIEYYDLKINQFTIVKVIIFINSNLEKPESTTFNNLES
jgi:hypothetical protein